MGVPGLFSYLARKYPKVVEPAQDEESDRDTPYHNLYIGPPDTLVSGLISQSWIKVGLSKGSQIETGFGLFKLLQLRWQRRT